MQIGDIVTIKTKHYGIKTGVLIEEYPKDMGPSEWLVSSDDHPRNIRANRVDLRLVNTMQEDNPMDD